MTNLTQLYWDIDGVSLHTYAWAIETKAGSRFSTAAKRGEDTALPFHTGHLYEPKMRDPHFPALPMWIWGYNQDGSADGSMTEEAKLQLNYDYLLSLFDRNGQFPLTKRFFHTDGTTIKTATAQAELLDPPEITVPHRNLWKVIWELKLADPYYYGAPIVAGTPSTINNPGNRSTGHLTITMAAGTVTFPDGNWIQYTGAGSAVIDCQTGNAKVGANFVNGQILRNRRFPQWPQLVPGNNVITGASSITYEPAYA